MSEYESCGRAESGMSNYAKMMYKYRRAFLIKQYTCPFYLLAQRRYDLFTQAQCTLTKPSHLLSHLSRAYLTYILLSD